MAAGKSAIRYVMVQYISLLPAKGGRWEDNMDNLKIVITDKDARVCTPYNPDFVEKIKGIGGAWWTGAYWRIPIEAAYAARSIMRDVYGYDDISENETVTLKLTFNEDIREHSGDVVYFGKVLAHAYSRDGGARVGEDVAFISGGATSGGSRKHWDSVVEEGSVTILSNVNKNVYERTKLDEDITVELIEDKVDRMKLQGEKERLLKRVADIDRILQESNGTVQCS